jgi:hypothetical protein
MPLNHSLYLSIAPNQSHTLLQLVLFVEVHYDAGLSYITNRGTPLFYLLSSTMKINQMIESMKEYPFYDDRANLLHNVTWEPIGNALLPLTEKNTRKQPLYYQ